MNAIFITVDLSARALLAVVLIMAGLLKLFDFTFTSDNFQKFELFKKRFVSIIAIILPLTELTIAFGLLFPLTIIYASVVSMFLFATFLVILLVTLKKGKAVSCGCFGKDRQERIGKRSIVRVGAFFASSFFIFVNHAFVVANASIININSTLPIGLAVGSLVCVSIGMVLIPHRILQETDVLSAEYWKKRRAFVKIMGWTGILILTSLPRLVGAAGCCKCEYQRHYDPTCCTNSPLGVHHYWKRCYNTCTGARGSWRKIQPYSCECECRMCQDRTWIQDECCYQWDCNCCGPCPC